MRLERDGDYTLGAGIDATLPLRGSGIDGPHARLFVGGESVSVAPISPDAPVLIKDELLADTGEAAELPARRFLERILHFAPDARIGVAVCPGDANDVDGLLTGARTAARSAERAGVPLVSQCAEPLEAGGHAIFVADPAMRRLYAQARRLAPTDLPLLVTGETGVGKELVAQALHAWSPRKDRPLVALNCAAISENLFESELFGHEKGAFTDARAMKPGLLEAAHGGAVLLDEIGECSLRVQAKLLRVLETKRACRVGSVVERAIDVRVLAAPNPDLQREVAEGRFRQDVYWRLGAATIFVPPLRDRPLDVPVLARAFLARACERAGRPAAHDAHARRAAHAVAPRLAGQRARVAARDGAVRAHDRRRSARHRRPDGRLQPPALRRAPGGRAVLRRTPQGRALPAAARYRPAQAGQRRPRPPGRRRGAASGRDPPGTHDAARGPGRALWRRGIRRACAGIGLPEAKLLAERLRGAIERLEIHFEGLLLRVTVSTGATGPGSTPSNRGEQTLLKRTDEALYMAKEMGRNRTIAL